MRLAIRQLCLGPGTASRFRIGNNNLPPGSGASAAPAVAAAAGDNGNNRGLLPDAGNPNKSAQTIPQSSAEAGAEGRLPASLPDVDIISGLLFLTPDGLFCPPAGGVGMGASSADPGNDMSNTNLQTLGMFNPTLLRNFQASVGNLSGNNNLAAKFSYPAPGTGGMEGLGLRGRDWIAASPHGLEAEKGAAPAFNPVAGPEAHKPEGPGPGSGVVDEGRDGESSISSAQRWAAPGPAMDHPADRGDLWRLGNGLFDAGGGHK